MKVKNKAPFSTASPLVLEPEAIFTKQDKPNGFTQRALKSCSHKGFVEGEAEIVASPHPSGLYMGYVRAYFKELYM